MTTSPPKPFTPSAPCPVCKTGTAGCSRTTDSLILCRKQNGPVSGFRYQGQAKGDDQWGLFREEDDAPPIPGPPPSSNGQAINWQARAKQYAEALTPTVRSQLAEQLGLPECVLVGLDIGYLADDRHGPCWTFPERNGAGQIIGISRRYGDGSKKAMLSSQRGLFLPSGWDQREGPIFCPEGASDTLALTALGFSTVGRPNNLGGVGQLAELFRDVPTNRRIVIVGDHDTDADGKSPGRDGAVQVAGQLAEKLGRPVSWVLPPKGHKDVRAWLLAQNLDPKLADAWHDTGETLLAEWQGKYQEITPTANAPAATKEPEPAWEPPVPLDGTLALPAFPVQVLPCWLQNWVVAEAEATQTPPELAALLALVICGAALAGKVRVSIRPGWSEPTNLFTVVALPSGDRKSAVFADAMRPVVSAEKQLQQQAAPQITKQRADRGLLEERLKVLQKSAAKAKEPAEYQKFKAEAEKTAEELANSPVPQLPQLWCEDETPENLARLLALHGGHILQASAEATPIEIIKGRYADKTPNFDVYLKGHAGDPLRVGRIGREQETVEAPALSVALTVQPDVIRGLTEHASLLTRGFLARWLYALPTSRVGSRKIAPAAVADELAQDYQAKVSDLWKASPPACLAFSPEGEAAMYDFQAWLEPQLCEGEPLCFLAGWAQKLPGAVARLAAILHAAQAITSGSSWPEAIEVDTVQAAIQLGRDYLLPHARAAFGLMGADPKLADVRRVVKWLTNSRNCRKSREGGGTFIVKESEIHGSVWGGSRPVESTRQIIRLVADMGYLRPLPLELRPGPGNRPSPRYQVNPLLFSALEPDSENSENSEN
jgi:hypothetical protein